MPHMTKGKDVLDVQPVLVDAMKAKGWKLADEATTKPAPTPIAIPAPNTVKENNNG